MMSCFGNCFNLLKVTGNIKWMNDHFPITRNKVSHCLFRLLPRLANRRLSNKHGNSGKGGGPSAAGGGDHPGWERPPALCDASSLQPSPGWSFFCQTWLWSLSLSQAVESLTVEECKWQVCEEESVDLADTLLNKGGLVWSPNIDGAVVHTHFIIPQVNWATWPLWDKLFRWEKPLCLFGCCGWIDTYVWP